jgi:hypothetical protein
MTSKETLLAGTLLGIFFDPECSSVNCAALHSQTVVLFIGAAMRTSNPKLRRISQLGAF